MILTITLNPSVDRRYNVAGFKKGRIFRTDQYQYTVGGKGLNVTKVIRDLQEKSFAIGLLGGHNGKFISNGLDKMGIDYKFINISQESRSCLAIISEDGSQTEILEKGPFVNQGEIEEFLLLYESLLDKVEVISASGSIPNGLNDNIYKELIRLANRKNKKFILDSSGRALEEGIEGLPYLVKPNREEIEFLMGKRIESIEELIDAGNYILQKGVNIVIISLGAKGALIFKGKNVYKVNIPNIDLVNPVGSGDAMIAGISVAIDKGLDFETMIKLGTACGTANAMESETGRINKDNIKSLMEDISIEEI